MKDLLALKNKVQAKVLELVTQRGGASVYKAETDQGTVFVKADMSKVAQDRYCEILEALNEFSLAPKVLNKFEWEEYAVIVMSAMEGNQIDFLFKNCSRGDKISLLRNAGLTLGNLHQAIKPTQLLEMKFWQDRDGAILTSNLWSQHLDSMISKWMSRINPAASDYKEFNYQLDELLKYCKNLREPKNLNLLHCDYTGRNILSDNKNNISGVLDFEAARIGDAVYDLAKLVWVDIDFSDIELRTAFLQGWEMTYGEEVPQKEFLCYVGIQCLAAIAWTDKNKPIEGTDLFRSSAIKTLRTVLNELKIYHN
ncbi:aminoglycoside phosphotransferase family protein [Acinetobacter baumannii]|nr:aminoglycoside phosphotransferase family protein [Acinetobacter baumannii]MDC5547838.1 aminoglycoside phosphotransferase family protein [Acinetobacter baumannii]MDX7929016.1 aminoglycoside phosphotransferase family protein [Acinetobacter baumannii]